MSMDELPEGDEPARHLVIEMNTPAMVKLSDDLMQLAQDAVEIEETPQDATLAMMEHPAFRAAFVIRSLWEIVAPMAEVMFPPSEQGNEPEVTE